MRYCRRYRTEIRRQQGGRQELDRMTYAVVVVRRARLNILIGRCRVVVIACARACERESVYRAFAVRMGGVEVCAMRVDCGSMMIRTPADKRDDGDIHRHCEIDGEHRKRSEYSECFFHRLSSTRSHSIMRFIHARASRSAVSASTG